MQAPQGNAGRARRLNPDNRSKGKPSQEVVDEALKKLGQSGTEKARSIVPDQATQNPRAQVAPPQARSPQPQPHPQSPASQPKAPAVDAKRPAYSEQMARAEVEALIHDFKRTGTFPGEALKQLCAEVPQAETWFADAFDQLKPRLSSYPTAFAAFEWMRSEVAAAAKAFLFKKQSPEATIEKWKIQLGDLAVTRTWIREMNKFVPARSCRVEVVRDPCA